MSVDSEWRWPLNRRYFALSACRDGDNELAKMAMISKPSFCAGGVCLKWQPLDSIGIKPGKSTYLMMISYFISTHCAQLFRVLTPTANLE